MELLHPLWCLSQSELGLMTRNARFLTWDAQTGLRKKKEVLGAGCLRGGIHRKTCPLPSTPVLCLRLASFSRSASLRASSGSLFSTAGEGLKYYRGGVWNAPCGPAPMALERHKKQISSVTRRRNPATHREFSSLPGLLAAMYFSLH